MSGISMETERRGLYGYAERDFLSRLTVSFFFRTLRKAFNVTDTGRVIGRDVGYFLPTFCRNQSSHIEALWHLYALQNSTASRRCVCM